MSDNLPINTAKEKLAQALGIRAEHITIEKGDNNAGTITIEAEAPPGALEGVEYALTRIINSDRMSSLLGQTRRDSSTQSCRRDGHDKRCIKFKPFDKTIIAVGQTKIPVNDKASEMTRA